MNPIHTLVWLRDDLRLSDNPALHAALETWRENPAHTLALVFIHAPQEEAPFAPGAASNWWRHHSLIALAKDIAARGGRLILRQGSSLKTLQQLIEQTQAKAIYWNRRYEPAVVQRDQHIKQSLHAQGCQAKSFNGAMLHEPWTVLNAQQRPFRVFTPYHRACLKHSLHGAGLRPPWPAPKHLPPCPDTLSSLPIDALGLAPRQAWDGGIRQHWQPGEAGAQQRLEAMVGHKLNGYAEHRDFPALDATSALSPHLHFGELSPHQLWWHCQQQADDQTEPFLRQLHWREFALQLLYHFPDSSQQALNPKYQNFPWSETDPGQLKRWQQGQTGIPIIDAGMRELWHTGTMHNRVRMLVASLLTKNLRYSWQLGAQWFWDTLVDADLANNSMGWQWVAGSGADAAPYFRIFNPVTQSQRFDPDGHYLRRWLPELAKLPAPHLHAPGQAPSPILSAAGIELGKHYPHPIVDLRESRQQALDALQTMKEQTP